MANRDVSTLLDRLAQAEHEFLSQGFLAPAVRGGVVHVRIAGVIMRLRIEPADFQGWGIFFPMSHETALLEREATLMERRRYLQIMTNASLILCDRNGDTWTAVAAGCGRDKLQLTSTVPVHLVDDADMFDTVKAGFDGTNFWFDRVDPRADSATTAWLRTSIRETVEPMTLQRKGLTAHQRVAYAVHYATRIKGEQQTNRDRVELQLRAALEHAGAKLEGYVEHKDGIRVTYTAAGRRRISSVNKDDFTIQVAGICLSGQDRKFDLASLVGVLNESHSRYAVDVGNDGISEQDYWDIHPPE